MDCFPFMQQLVALLAGKDCLEIQNGYHLCPVLQNKVYIFCFKFIIIQLKETLLLLVQCFAVP